MATTDKGYAPHRDDPIYDQLHDSPDFIELRKRYRGFVIPATVAFLTWYLLYVVMSNWATGFMDTQVIGNINVALVFGLLQFVSTFAITAAYVLFADRKLDPLSAQMRDEIESGEFERGDK